MTIDVVGLARYTEAAYASSRRLTQHYSSSFGSATRLFDERIRHDIYAIYGLLRVADELVDTYGQADAAVLLANLEREVYAALETGYSTNLQVHAFAHTARHYGIDASLIKPFFASMAMDVRPVRFNKRQLQRYIYGSAEAVGLMCLRVFCLGDADDYETLTPGAMALGSAFQKVNFLRDLAADRKLGRHYLPQLVGGQLTEAGKRMIIADIRADFSRAEGYIERLPLSARTAVQLSYDYYVVLLNKLEHTAPAVIEARRVRLSPLTKGWLWLTGQLV